MNDMTPLGGGPDETDTLAPDQIHAIVQGSHGDPFAILGVHPVGHDIWVIRALLPYAKRVEAIEPGGHVLAVLHRRHVVGLFSARVRSTTRPVYRLRIETRDGPLVISDPYSFGPVLPQDAVWAIGGGHPQALYDNMGAQLRRHDEVDGTNFAVWAPNAWRVSVVGDFNGWDGRIHPMRLRHDGGLWELFLPEVGAGARYKFEILGPHKNLLPLKADPYAFQAEHPPSTASVVHGRPDLAWNDAGWIERRQQGDARRKPMSIYECHLGSWARVPEEGNRFLTYREMAERLIPYVKDLGFTHIELLPITEFPFDGSWGYQPVSLFAPTSRFGSPDDFAAFVEAAHQHDLGVILDWVPAHFPNDAHGLALFDGTHLFEHADPRQGFHHDWGTYIYNYGRSEVCAFLVANARFWIERFHLDGLRVDAVASMLYLDYSRKADEWVPNRYGGNQNLEAIDFLHQMNSEAYAASPGAITIAEESTAFPGVSQPVYAGGLGFGFKWNMGWMHDTLHYMARDPYYRRHHHHELTFSFIYAFSENYVLPLSHDEVVHGKGSLIGRMPGDTWQRFANLRAYFGFMWGHPGKKLLFMGGEFAQPREWNHDVSLDWHLLEDPMHRGVQSLIRDLNAVYGALPALHARDCETAGLRALVADDQDNSVLIFARFGDNEEQIAIVASNFTPVPRSGYRVGVPASGFYREAINTDASCYGGSNMGNSGGVHAEAVPSHGLPFSLTLTLPPLATLILDRVGP